MGSMSIWHWLILALVVMLLFGKGRLSDFMGDAAKGIKSFKKGLAEDDEPTAPQRPAARLQGQPPVDPNVDRDLQPMKDDRPHQG
jgi:sec-independent protein translocase protein TatA